MNFNYNKVAYILENNVSLTYQKITYNIAKKNFFLIQIEFSSFYMDGEYDNNVG